MNDLRKDDPRARGFGDAVRVDPHPPDAVRVVLDADMLDDLALFTLVDSGRVTEVSREALACDIVRALTDLAARS